MSISIIDPIKITNNLTETIPGSALDAVQGKGIDTRVTTLENKALDVLYLDYWGNNEMMPEASNGAYAITYPDGEINPLAVTLVYVGIPNEEDPDQSNWQLLVNYLSDENSHNRIFINRDTNIQYSWTGSVMNPLTFPLTKAAIEALLTGDISTHNHSTKANVSDVRIFRGTVGGTVNAMTVTVSPTYDAYTDKDVFYLTLSGANTITNPTLNVNSKGAKEIVKKSGSALLKGDYQAGTYVLCYDIAIDKFHLMSPSLETAATLPQALYKHSVDNTQHSITGSGSKLVYTFPTIPANTLNADSVLWFNIIEGMVGVGSKDVYIKINGINVFNWGATASGGRQRMLLSHLRNGNVCIFGTNYNNAHVTITTNDSVYPTNSELNVGGIGVDWVVTVHCTLATPSDTYAIECANLVIEK